MSRRVEQLTEEVLALPSEERAELVEKLTLSLETSRISEAWAKEASSRLDDLRSGRVTPIPSETVMARALLIAKGEA